VNYVSTRGRAPVLGFEDVLLTGLASDGGLYVPESWPQFSAAELTACAGRSYAEVAVKIIAPFVGDAVPAATLGALAADAYRGFAHPATAPLVQIDDNDWLLELFHGPTLAFKDFALQLLGRLFDHVLSKRGERVTVVGATSGDTGSAAIAAFKDRANLEIFILHPKDRVSEVQRRQMTTVAAANVHNIAIEGSFDDCQALVKAMFNDAQFRAALNLSAVNSINWARVMAQVVYYVTAAVALGGPARPVAFAVPTGNFGDAYAGYVASRCGLPVARLVVATNRNDILARLFHFGRYLPGEVVATMSPSMDIQVASNFERLLFELCRRDGAAVEARLSLLAKDGQFDLTAQQLAEVRGMFDSARIDEDETLAEIGRVFERCGRLIDPHSAIGSAAARKRRGAKTVPMIALATAHAAKFPDAVVRATGLRPELPASFQGLMDEREHYAVLARDLGAVQTYIRDRAGRSDHGHN